MERDGEQTNDDIGQGKVGNVHVGHCPHPLEDDDVYHQAVPSHCYQGGAHIEQNEKCFQTTWEYK